MIVYVLYRHWDTPDNEGNEVVGVYLHPKDAVKTMKADAEATKAYYDQDFWNEDMTWEGEQEIYLGHDPMNGSLATIYCWEIVSAEVQ